MSGQRVYIPGTVHVQLQRTTRFDPRYPRMDMLRSVSRSSLGQLVGTGISLLIFTERCILVQSALLRPHIVCLSVSLSDRPSVIGWNSSTIISRLVSVGRSLFVDPNIRGSKLTPRGTPGNLAQSGPPPPLISASETFDRKSRPNGYR